MIKYFKLIEVPSVGEKDEPMVIVSDNKQFIFTTPPDFTIYQIEGKVMCFNLRKLFEEENKT